MTKQKFAILLTAWCEGNITNDQSDEFTNAVKSGQYDEFIAEFVESHLEAGDLVGVINMQRKEDVLAELLNKTFRDQGDKTSVTAHRIHFLKTAWFRYAAAIIIIFGIGAYLWNTTNDQGSITKTQPVPAKNDVMPGAAKAILTLSDGRQVTLDATAGNVIADGNVAISNNNNGLVYSSSNVAVNNRMTTPRGGQYQLTLADGTKVWLNAASTITYPTAFTGKTREIQITGEAYFEVAKNKEKPFIVKTNKDEIVVLGTSFNVQNYPDEKLIKTTLVEGSVKVNGDILKPHQAYMNGKIITTDVDQDIAWKNGVFNFNKLRVEEAMRQIARWYDVEIIYDQGIPDKKFVGKMERKLQLKDMLSGLEGIAASFMLEGRTLYVRPLKTK